MSKLRIHNFAISLDGYGAGPQQDLDNPLGVGGLTLHEWVFATRTFQQIHGEDGGVSGIDDDFVARGFTNIGAWILGRNMFGPVRGSRLVGTSLIPPALRGNPVVSSIVRRRPCSLATVATS